MKKKRNGALNSAGVDHVKYGIHLVATNQPNASVLYEKFGKTLPSSDTRMWNTVWRDQTKKKSPNYTIDEEGQLCFQGRPVIAWENFHQEILDVVASLPPNPSEDMVKDRVKEVHYDRIPAYAITLFCALCGKDKEEEETDGGGGGGGASMEQGVVQQHGIGGINPSFTFGDGSIATMGRVQHEGLVSCMMQQDRHQHWNAFYTNNITNNNTDNRTTNNITNNTNNTNNYSINPEQQAQFDRMEDGQQRVAATLEKHSQILRQIERNTEQRVAPPSALRMERHLAAQEAGQTLVFGDAKGTPPAKDPSAHCVKKAKPAEQDEMHTASEQQDFSPYRQFVQSIRGWGYEFATSDDLSTDSAALDNDLDDAHIKAIAESFNVVNGIVHEGDFHVLDPEKAAEEEAEEEKAKVSAMAKDEESKNRFSTENDDHTPVKKRKIIPPNGWIGTPIGAALAAHDTWKCRGCDLHVPLDKNKCFACEKPKET
jgi:hypothetical protein